LRRNNAAFAACEKQVVVKMRRTANHNPVRTAANKKAAQQRGFLATVTRT
jgi:hypothetical protein